jgi:hypothetical protein
VVGLLFKDSFISTGFSQNSTKPAATQNVKILKFQATNKSSVSRTVQIALDGATLDLAVPPRAIVLSEAEKVRMLDAVVVSYSGQVRISIEKNGKQPVVLKADKAVMRYSKAWFPFSKEP